MNTYDYTVKNFLQLNPPKIACCKNDKGAKYKKLNSVNAEINLQIFIILKKACIQTLPSPKKDIFLKLSICIRQILFKT